MRARLAAVAVAITLVAPVLAGSEPVAAVGLRISGGRLVEADGTPLVLRGVSHAHAWYRDRTGALADIKSLGANAVRVVLSGGRWGPADDTREVARIVALCKASRLICVLENHDTTGYGEQQHEWTLDRAADFWIGVRQALLGQENYVLVNVGNSPYGNAGATAWTAATGRAIDRLRRAGLKHVLVVDAPNWGQDWQFVMRDHAPAILRGDPRHNTLFSVHMYGVFGNDARVDGYLRAFRSRGVPVLIGGFGDRYPDGDPDEDAILSRAAEHGVGYLGWLWSGNGDEMGYLDAATGFNPNRLTPWGRRLFLGPHGIRATAREATIYGGRSSAGLRALAAARGRHIGFAALAGPLADDAAYRRLAAAEFNQVTPELVLKWDATEPVRGSYTFTAADELVTFAEASGQTVHGHTLVWHQQLPGWVSTLDAPALRTAVREHIAAVVGRYAARPEVRSWDVVNEPLDDAGRLRRSVFLDRLGPGYLADSFHAARAADPDAKLCLNDYGVEGINPKSTALYDLVRSLRVQGVPVDCVGLQAHLGVRQGLPAGLRDNLRRFADLGVEVRITELDVRVPVPATAADIGAQNRMYAAVVEACLAVPACTGLTLWGLTDGHSWVPGTFPGEGQALLFDATYRPKAAYAAVRSTLSAPAGVRAGR